MLGICEDKIIDKVWIRVGNREAGEVRNIMDYIASANFASVLR